MIVVIADDLTGAAELAGAAHQRGLTVEVQTVFDGSSKADVIAVDTNTRSLPSVEAALAVRKTAIGIKVSEPDWVYKKTDSVLRGNVRQEIEVLLEVFGHRASLFVPANPSKGRLIHGGRYFVHGVPLHETDFARDPDHPRHTADVATLLGESPRIQVPDTTCAEDIQRHAKNLKPDILPAGGVDFFEELLSASIKPTRPPTSNCAPARSTLFVCGSAAAWMRGRASQFANHPMPLLTLDEEAFEVNWPPELETAFASRISAAIKVGQPIAVAIGRPPQSLPFNPCRLADRLCAAVARAIRDGGIDRICVEGGATGSALLRNLGWTKLPVVCQWAGGVVELRASDRALPTVVLKVGSYDWPVELLSR